MTKARGGKKGKRFVEDKESMFEILRLVNDVKEEKIGEKLEKGVSSPLQSPPLLPLAIVDWCLWLQSGG